jgi:four helix bundle suffix protein
MEPGYKLLASYQVSRVAFELGWDFVPHLYPAYEDRRQRDQIKQALRSLKQNIVEGSADRSLSSKLKLYDVAKASGAEAREDVEDAMRRKGIAKWPKNDPRLQRLQRVFESNPSFPLFPSCPSILKILGRNEKEVEGLEGQEIILNYLLDLLIRSGYLLDQQIRAVEQKHQTEGGYRENLLKRRLEYRQQHHT